MLILLPLAMLVSIYASQPIAGHGGPLGRQGSQGSLVMAAAFARKLPDVAAYGDGKILDGLPIGDACGLVMSASAPSLWRPQIFTGRRSRSHESLMLLFAMP